MPELEIKCYGGIPPAALSLRSCLCYMTFISLCHNCEKAVKDSFNPRRTKSPLVLSAEVCLVTAKFPHDGFIQCILA